METQILYEDKDMLIAVKPAGVLSEDAPGQETMPALLREYLGGGYVGCVHRLDRTVGGVMVYSKRPEMTGKLSARIAEHNFTKEYLAVVQGVPAEREGTFTDLLFKDSSRNKSFVVKRMRRGVKEAVLHYQLLDTVEREEGPWSLVKIALETGRSHQIRVQFSSRKMPLVGDGKYGSKVNRSGIALWSYRIAFSVPGGRKVEGCCPPKGFPWNLFSIPDMGE